MGWISRPQGGSGKWGLNGANIFTYFLPFFFCQNNNREKLKRDGGGAKSTYDIFTILLVDEKNSEENFKKKVEAKSSLYVFS